MSDTNQLSNLGEIMNWSIDFLSKKGLDDARSSVEWILTDILKCSRMELFLHFERPLNETEKTQFKRNLLDCANHRPVQHIIGNTEFYGLYFAVNDQVLIPRPETERLVEWVVEHYSKQSLHILDIGAGSGAIAIALALHLPQTAIDALEVSAPAIEILKRNLRFHNLLNRITVVHHDIFTFRPSQKYDLIVSNPPYIAADEWSGLDQRVSFYEPRLALTDNQDGLSFYRHFASQFKEWLKPGGTAIMEFGGNHQSMKLLELFKDYPNIEIIKDYQKDDRLLIVQP